LALPEPGLAAAGRTGDGGPTHLAGSPPGASAVPAWALIALAGVGVGISAYLTTLHYAGGAAVCAVGGVFNCGAVLTSSYSVVPGTQIPVTVPGMLWFLVSGGLAALALRRRRQGRAEPGWLRPGHLLWSVMGIAAALYLVRAEVVLGKICEWCTAVHLLVFVSLLLALARLAPARPLPPASSG
jgi:uncharacterized membrane protein